ncbi:major facilitator superfamily domain-containing protein [Boletus edulis]|uniref:Major facilitator superfamily domain-containing protein n=1 Tax=Boletus edulis BED1 TaxID=1328754 RepID=A0AAD4C8G7_BOLED|nr:major facilitator superfamily domain-containing protein [Boletus edulis]KAF8450852.1 major facilitator superfamily domain-containing protein [Boletus edulis BED1]
MADILQEKQLESGSEDSGSHREEIFERPKGLKGIYYHPYFQVTMLGFVCFMCPGMFNALGGIGGGGQVSTTAQANAGTATYATFAFFAFFSGTVNNVLGPRLTLFLGTLGYSLYIASFLADNIHPNAYDFVVAAGAILGLCAGLLWTAQGCMMMAYPTEAQKGLFIGIFWAIFNLGAVIGSAVAFGLNFNNQTNGVGNGTYIGFLILTLIGVCLAPLMADPQKIIRTDGTKVTLPRQPSWKTEFYSLYVALKTDPMVILLFPMFVASNYFYTWQQNDYNAALFNIRTRSLNAFVYWAAQIFGSLFLGYCVLDLSKYRRRTRAFAGWVIVTVMVFAVHIWAYSYQKDYTRATVTAMTTKMDFKDSAYPAHAWLYIFCGLLDAMWQTYVYWLLGAMSNDLAKLAVFTGFYKGLQSAGAAGVWHADAVPAPYINIFISTWVLCAAGVIFALPMIHYRIKDHTDLDDEQYDAKAHAT